MMRISQARVVPKSEPSAKLAIRMARIRESGYSEPQLVVVLRLLMTVLSFSIFF